jgi:hypothetical protein
LAQGFVWKRPCFSADWSGLCVGFPLISLKAVGGFSEPRSCEF